MAIPNEAGGGRKRIRLRRTKPQPPPPEVAVRAIKPQRTVKSKRGSFPAPHPEVTRPVTKQQRRAIDKAVANEPLHLTAKGRQLVKQGKLKPGRGYVGGDPLTSINQIFHIAAGASGKGLKEIGAPEIVRNAAKEVIDSPAQAVPATVMAVQHPNQVVKQLEQTAKHPVRSFKQSPVTTLLLVRGGIAALGRGAGAALRLAPKKSAVYRTASTERAPLKLAGGAEHQQHYSKDVTAKAVQKAGEKSKRFQEHRAKRVTNRRIDRSVGVNEGMRRVERDRARTVVTEAKPKRGHGAVSLINEGVIKHPKSVRDDLHQELGRLQEARKSLSQPHDLKANQTSIESVKELLGDKKFLTNPAPAFAAARIYARGQKQIIPERVHYGDLTKTQAEQRILAPHAIRDMGLRYDEGGQQIFDRAASLKAVARRARKTGKKIRARVPAQETTTAGFRTPTGKEVATREILADFKAKGGDPRNLAYIPEVSAFKRPGNFYLKTSRRPAPERKVFKGINTKGGLYERDYGVLEQQAAKAAGRVSAHQSVDRVINDYGVTKPGGKFFGYDEAQKEILNQQTATGRRYVPLQVLRGQSGDAAARIKEGLQPSELPQMFRPAEKGDGNIVLLPEAVAKRISAHENIGSRVPLVKGFQSVNQRFRHVVLPTSPRWAVGNIVEMLGRMAIEDPTLFKSVISGKKIEDAVRAAGGQKAVDRLRSAAGAGHIGAQSKFDIHRVPETQIVEALHKLRQVHGPKQAADAWDLYKRAVFGANTRAEDLIYYAGLGKEAAREVHELTGAWHKTLNFGNKAYEDVAKGLLQSDNVERYARAIDDMRGRYSNLSPLGRSATLTMTPFAPWYINALNFVFVTLPVHHPIKTALLGQAVQSQRKKLESLGFTHFGPEDARVPAFLLGRVQTKKGLLPASQFTPFGAFTDVGGNAANLVLPQASGALQNLSGQSWTGQPLKDSKGHPIPQGDPRTVAIALNTIAESFTPFLRQARVVREKGGSSADTSTVLGPRVKKSRPGTTYAEGAKRAFNPLYVSSGGKKPKLTASGEDFTDLVRQTPASTGGEDFTDLVRKP